MERYGKVAGVYGAVKDADPGRSRDIQVQRNQPDRVQISDRKVPSDVLPGSSCTFR